MPTLPASQPFQDSGAPLPEDGRGGPLREVGGGFLALAAIFTGVALALDQQMTDLVGPVGGALGAGLRFVFGEWLGFTVPAIMMIAAVRLVMGARPAVHLRVLIGCAVVTVALCGFLALPTADMVELRAQTFARAGVVGAFLVEWEGLGLVGAMGTLGAAFVLGGTLFAGLVLATGSGLAALGDRVIGRVRAREDERHEAPEFARAPHDHELAWDEEVAAGLPTPMPRRRVVLDEPAVSVAPPPDAADLLEGDAVLRARRSPLKIAEPPAAPSGVEGADRDVEAALRALEAAEMDRDFEAALAQEHASSAEVALPEPPKPAPAIAPLPLAPERPRNTGARFISGGPFAGMPLVAHDSAPELAAPRSAELPRIVEPPPPAPAKPAHALASFLDEPPLAPAPAAPRVSAKETSALEAFLDEPAAPRAVAPPIAPAPVRKMEEPAAELPRLFAPRPVAPRASSPELPKAIEPPKPAPKMIEEPDFEDALVDDQPPFDMDDDAPTAMEAAELRAIRRKVEGLDIKGLPPAAEATPVLGSRMATFDIPEPESPNAPIAAPAVPAAKHEPPKPLLLPDIALLDDPPQVDTRMPREEILEISQTLERTLGEFGITAKVVEVRQGPVVTRFELKPAAGVKVSRIVGLEHDLAMALRASSIRIQAPIPGKAVVGVEVPNRQRQTVYLRELIGCTEFWDHPSPLAFSLGKTIEGAPFFCDLKRMPHLLIAGATGTGKSVCLNSILCSLIYRQRPDRLKLVMVDPKRVELSIYDDIPHLIAPVVCEPKRAAAALAWAVEQMEERYKLLVEFNVRNIDGYNAIAEHPEKNMKLRGKKVEPMPHMVVVVDELADLMITSKADVEESIQRLAQMARAVGIHLILATQRPSVNVITGIIKANFPSRIAFQVSQKVDSRTILDQNGAEALLGRGDMLFSAGGVQKPMRIQGCFVSDQEVERIADHWRAQSPPLYEIEEFEPLLSEKEKRELAKLMGNPESLDDLDMQDGMVKGPSRGTNRVMGTVTQGTFIPHRGGSANADDGEIDDALVRAAARTILEARKGSTSLVQRRLKVGFARAGRLMDMLQEMGIVGAYNGSKPREILVDPEAALAQLDALEVSLAPGGAKRAAIDEDFDSDAT